MSTFDRHVLTLAMLRGDRAARVVLADLMEEQGDFVLANFARRARLSADGDLDLALHLLDTRQLVAVGCEFVARHARDGLAVLMRRVRHACCQGDVAELNRLHYKLVRYHGGPFLSWTAAELFKDACESLATAVRCLAHVLKADDTDDFESQDEWRHECVTSVSVLARQVRASRGGGRQRELSWQLTCVRGVLEPLVAAK